MKPTYFFRIGAISVFRALESSPNNRMRRPCVLSLSLEPLGPSGPGVRDELGTSTSLRRRRRAAAPQRRGRVVPSDARRLRLAQLDGRVPRFVASLPTSPARAYDWGTAEGQLWATGVAPCVARGGSDAGATGVGYRRRGAMTQGLWHRSNSAC